MRGEMLIYRSESRYQSVTITDPICECKYLYVHLNIRQARQIRYIAECGHNERISTVASQQSLINICMLPRVLIRPSRIPALLPKLWSWQLFTNEAEIMYA